ncbi:MAG TPA: glutamyl-tRNA reductase, partial [Thiotrichales bacterium]|nr:glutamyl-tRNA reductase [Thiotrichales bacterium]
MPHTTLNQTLTTIGINHQTAPVDVREQVAFPPDRLIQALKSLRESGLAQGSAILSTCNRSELYLTHRHQDITPLQTWLHDFFQLSHHTLTPYTYTYMGRDAV